MNVRWRKVTSKESPPADDLAGVSQQWTRLGYDDPYWGVLSHENKRGGAWQEDEFYETGRQHVTGVLNHLKVIGLTPPATGAVLDFGCGVGRLTLAFAHEFERVTGVDVSPGMLERARAIGSATPNCVFILNDRADLAILPSSQFDFVYTTIVLQHLPVSLASRYITEFFRVAKVGAVVVFQVPAHLTWKPRLRRLIKHLAPGLIGAVRQVARRPVAALPYEMNGIPRSKVIRLVRAAGGDVVDVSRDDQAGPSWVSYTYWCRSRG